VRRMERRAKEAVSGKKSVHAPTSPSSGVSIRPSQAVCCCAQSRNQVLRLFSDRYTPANFSEELTEASIKEGGRVEVTGFPTLGLLW